VTIVPTDSDRLISGRLTVGVFVTVVALIVIVLAAQKIPHAKRPVIQHPRVVVATITHTPGAAAPLPPG
jgi:hypothetical protein